MVAPVDSAVLLLGETGTGKEVIARAIHDAGPRRHQRFVAGELRRDSCRPARKRTIRPRARRIHGRGHRPSDDFRPRTAARCSWTKSAICRWNCSPNCSERSRSNRLNAGSGGGLTSVDVRVIAATNQDLEEMVQQRAFRADLFYRLNVFPIRVPPLRERAEDIPLLISHFVRRSPSVRARRLRSPGRSDCHVEALFVAR